VTVGISVLYRYVTTLNIACFFKTFPESGDAKSIGLEPSGAEQSDDRHRRLLRARRERPCCCRAA
jgi:hypothetical protein